MNKRFEEMTLEELEIFRKKTARKAMFRSSFREIQKKPAKERRATMEQTGTFNPKKFYEILAGILSRKYGVKITVQEIKKAA